MNNSVLNIKNLREITGAGFLDCKKALDANNNDVEASVDFLRKKGLAKATKKSSREAKEGAVGFYSNNENGYIIKVNTETDFAAKNEVFLNFLDNLGDIAISTSKSNVSLEDFTNLKIENQRTVKDLFIDLIAKIGENIILSNFTSIGRDGKYLSSYIHNSYRNNIGKIAVVLKYDTKIDDEQSKAFAKNLCMHIAASKPLAINVENLDKELVQREKDVQLESIKSSGKPQDILDKILDGKMNKFYSESTFYKQAYILDPDKTVEKKINDFSKDNRFEVINYYMEVIGS